MDIEHRFDEPEKRVLIKVGETTSGTAVSCYIAALTADRPELAGWDWINDVRESRGDVDNADIAMVAEAFAGAKAGPCWTIFVSHDPNLGLWCRVMDAMFNGRLHRAVLTPEAAVALLNTLRAANPALAPW